MQSAMFTDYVGPPAETVPYNVELRMTGKNKLLKKEYSLKSLPERFRVWFYWRPSGSQALEEQTDISANNLLDLQL